MPCGWDSAWRPRPPPFPPNTPRGYDILDGMAGEAETTHGYTENREAVLKRLRRIKGQVGGVERMVEENRY